MQAISGKSPPFHSRSRLSTWLLAVILIINPPRASFCRGQVCAADLTHLRDRSTMAGRRSPETRTFRMMELMEVVDGPTRYQVAALQFKSVLYSQYSSSLSTGSSISCLQLPRIRRRPTGKRRGRGGRIILPPASTSAVVTSSVKQPSHLTSRQSAAVCLPRADFRLQTSALVAEYRPD